MFLFRAAHARLVAIWLAALASVSLASARTLTAADGRAIEAEVLGFDGTDKVKIKRADTGQTFSLPIATFSESDQAALRAEAAEAAKKPAALPVGAVTLELSRAKFDTRREEKEVTLTNGRVVKDGIAITEEDWGYGISLRNTTPRPIEGLRGEYILFVKVDKPGGGAKSDGRLRRTRAKLAFEPIPVGGRITARTEAITARKTELAGGIVWRESGDSKTRDTLHGIWLRVYQGDTLVLESSSPGTLATTESWAGGDTR